MSRRPTVVDVRPPLQGWEAIAKKLGVSKRTAMRLRNDQDRPLRVEYDPFGRVYVPVARVEDWIRRWSQTPEMRAEKRTA